MLLSGAKGITLREILQALFRRKKIVLLIFFATIIPIALATFMLPPEYRSTAKVLLRREDRPGALNPYYSRLTQEEEIKSELEIIRSGPVLSKALGIAQARGASGAWSYDSEENKANVNEFSVGSLVGWFDEQTATDTTMARERVHERFRKRTTVEAVPGANVITISFDDFDPPNAAIYAQAIAEAYVQHDAEARGSDEARSFLSERIRAIKASLDSLEAALLAFRQGERLVSYGKQETILLDKYKDFDAQLAHVNSQAEIMAGKVGRLREIQTGEEGAVTDEKMDAHPNIRQLHARLLELRLQRNAMAHKYRPNHRLMRGIDEEITGAQQALQKEIGRQLQQEEERLNYLRLEQDVLSRLVAQIKSELNSYPAKQRELNELELAIENGRKIYSMLIARREEVSVEQARDRVISRIAIIDPARMPLEPIRPKPVRNLAFGLVLGLAAGALAGLMQEHFDRTLKSPEELGATLGVPVLGWLPEQKN